MADVTKTRAVVLGGSLAGLFAARVLSDAYDEVVVVDRDTLLGVTGPRRGCPQGKHINGLLAGGRVAVEKMYPGITEEIIADDTPTGDLCGNVRWYFNGYRLQQQHADLIGVGASRPMLEKHVCRRTAAIANVSFLEQHAVLGVTTTADKGTVTGARVQPVKGGDEVVLEADLVIDATGRGSRTPVWLEELGYGTVEEESKKVGLGYVTQHYRLKADPYHGDLSINPVASPQLPRGAIFAKTDGGRVELTAYGILGDHPPTDQQGFYEFVKTLAAPEIYEALQHAEPLDEPVAFRFPTTLRRRYERMTRLPAGLLAVGDAVTCFNPVYAQGMTVAALSALTLRSHLHSGAAPQPVLFYRDLAREVIDQPWAMTNIVDLNFPGVEGERTREVKIAQKFLKLTQIAATRDKVVAAAYMRTAGLIDPPETLRKPKMLLRILLQALRGPLQHEPAKPLAPIASVTTHKPNTGRTRKAA